MTLHFNSLAAMSAAGVWPPLADLALKCAIVLMAAWALAFAMRRASAAMRHLVWTLAVYGTLLLPILSALLPGWRVLPAWMKQERSVAARGSVPAQRPAIVDSRPRDFSLLERAAMALPKDDAARGAIPQAANVPKIPASAALPTMPRSDPPTIAPQPSASRWWTQANWQSWTLIVWGAGTSVMLLPMLLSLGGLWRLGRRATPITSGSWDLLLRECAGRLNVRRAVMLLQNRRQGMPMTWGFLRPKLLLCPEADGWPMDRRRVVLMHELAHIKRGDFMTQLIVQIARANYWFNPLMWIAAKQVAMESEGACDDLVLTQQTRASDYAEHLLTVAAGLKEGALIPVAAIAMARSSRLEGRLLAILDAKRNRRSLTVAGIVLAVAVLLSGVLPLAMMRAVRGDDAPAKDPAVTKPSAVDIPRAAGRIASGSRAEDHDDAHIDAIGSVAPYDRNPPGDGGAAVAQSVPVEFSISQDNVTRVVRKFDAHQRTMVDVYDRNFQKKLGHGWLTGIDNQIDATTGTLKCKAIVRPIDDALLFPNQFVNVRLILEAKQFDAELPAFDPLVVDVRALIAANFPDTLIHVSPDSFSAQHAAREFQIDDAAKAGPVPPGKHKEIGPADDGFILTLKRLNEPEMRQAAVPQVLNAPFWKCFINSSFDPATKQGVSVEFNFGANLKPEFKTALMKLVKGPLPAEEAAHRAVLEAQLQRARADLARRQKLFAVAAIGASDLQASKDEVELLEAELTGDAIAVAKVKLAAAERQLEIATKLFDAGALSAEEFQGAKDKVAISKAELTGDAVQVEMARVEAARRHVDIAVKLFKAGALTNEDLEKTESEFLIAKARLHEAQARKQDVKKRASGLTFQAIAVDSQTGNPIPNVRLWSSHHKGAEATSDKDGKIAIDGMTPGHFTFQIQVSGYLGRSPIGNFNYWELEVTDDMAPFKIELERVVRITGVVQDPDGNPVGGATVAPADGTGNSLTGDTSFSVPTAKDGTFVIELPASGAAKYNLEAHDGNQAQWRKWANGVLPPIQTMPGDELKDVVINLTRPATVRGHMKDETGKALVNREVRASAADKLENRYYDPTTTTDKNGDFELRYIRPGEQFIQAAPFFWCNVPEGGMTLDFKEGETNSRPVTLKEGETKVGVELTAPASTKFPSNEEQLRRAIERSERSATRPSAPRADENKNEGAAPVKGEALRVIEVKLEAARNELEITARRFTAGLADTLEYQAAKDKVQILEAELTGDAVRLAEARVVAAREQLKITENQHKAGLLTALDFEKAKSNVAIAEAELRVAVEKAPPSRPGNEGAARPAGALPKTATDRARVMKANLRNFKLDLQYNGQQDKPYYRLRLAVTPLTGKAPVDPFDLRVQITEEQAGKIIDYLAGEGFLDAAHDLTEWDFIPAATKPGYSLTVMNYYADLGWKMPMLKRLDGLKTALEGDAAANMDKLLGRLGGERKLWTKN